MPYHSPSAVNAAVELIGYIKPDFLFINGDLIDFYPISRFDRDPARKITLQQDLDATRGILKALRDASPASRIIYTPGNHEDRLRKYLLIHAEELASLEDLKLESLLRLADTDITLVPRNKVLIHHDMVVTHGDRCRSKSGATAHAMLDKLGTSGTSGHTHRAAKVCRTNLLGRKTWVESGCLCDLNPDYVDGVADWQHALVVGYTMDGHTELDLVMIDGGTLKYDGLLFDGDRPEQSGQAPQAAGDAGSGEAEGHGSRKGSRRAPKAGSPAD